MSEHTVHRKRVRQVATRSTSISAPARRADTSRQIYQENEFTSTLLNNATPLKPPYDTTFLTGCMERSNMLRQCVAAMVTNVALSGFDIVQAHKSIQIDEGEKAELESFLESANADESFTTVHSRIVEDYETYGYGFLEVIRDAANRVSLLRHVPAYTMQLLPKDKEPQLVTYEVLRGTRSAFIQEYKVFRRFVQVVNGATRFFKEFGDPRNLNMETGEFSGATKTVRATEIIHVRQTSDNPYGVPRWISQLPSILGSREAEECNLRYFEDNTVPPMMLTVAGGRLTAQSYKELRQLLTGSNLGKDRQNQILLVEAVPEREGLDDKGSVTLKVDKLTDARQSDGLFREYDESNQAKIRSSFRLPPTAVGLSQDVTFATANVSTFIAESQVYSPLRAVFDEVYNKRLVNGASGLNLRTCKLASRVAAIVNPEMLIKALTNLNVMGAVTPRTAIDAANRLLQIDLPQYPEKDADGWEEWMDAPIILATKGVNSDDEQNQKSPDIKDEEDGDGMSQPNPQHGQE